MAMIYHEAFIPHMTKNQLKYVHIGLCGYRGLSWEPGRKRLSGLDYVFESPFEYLVAYHLRILKRISENMQPLGKPWEEPDYRGKKLGLMPGFVNRELLAEVQTWPVIYPQHDEDKFKRDLAQWTAAGHDPTKIENPYKKSLVDLYVAPETPPEDDGSYYTW